MMTDVDAESWNEDPVGRPWAIALVWVLFVGVVGCMAHDIFTDLEGSASGPARAVSARAEGAHCCN